MLCHKGIYNISAVKYFPLSFFFSCRHVVRYLLMLQLLIIAKGSILLIKSNSLVVKETLILVSLILELRRRK